MTSRTPAGSVLDDCETLMLDMDGTLLDLAFDNYVWKTLIPERYAGTHGLPVDEARRELLGCFHFLRKQGRQPEGHYNECLADFLAPKESGKPDYLGAFACTAGIGIDAKLAEFEAEHDDYQSIMLKALADRLAESFAEHMHQRVRKELWGYAPEEELANEQLIAGVYCGIRPAPGGLYSRRPPMRPSRKAEFEIAGWVAHDGRSATRVPSIIGVRNSSGL